MKSETNYLHVVYFSRFIIKNNGDGGSRRVSQIMDAIQDFHPRFLSVPQRDFGEESINIPEIKYGNLTWNDIEFKKLITGEDYFYWSGKFRNGIANIRLFSHKWGNAINTRIPVDIAFVDEPVFFAPLIDKLNAQNIPVIGLEHNIETHVRGQVEEKFQHELFKKEIEYFKKCNLVVTISPEDTLVLNNFGVKTLLLPYYPIDEQKDLFLGIRQHRTAVQNKTGYILLGTAHNVPTLEGMVEVVRAWGAAHNLKNEMLHVVGYGTEKIQNILTDAMPENVTIMGGVEEDTLRDILKNIKAGIIYQSNGTGALTKIVELLLANVPVFANHHAARSYHNIPGVIEYGNFPELYELLGKDNFSYQSIDIPIPDKPRTDSLVRHIDSIIQERVVNRTDFDYRLIIDNQVKTINNLAGELQTVKCRLMELESIRQGYSYRLGRALLTPAIVIRNFLRKEVK